MEDQIKELQVYFIQKILSKEFELVKLDEHKWIISVDGRCFTFWVGNEDYGFNQSYDYELKHSFMDLGLNKDQEVLIWEVFSETHLKEQREITKNKRQSLYEELKKEFEDENEL